MKEEDYFSKYIYLEEISSTNDLCKILGEDKNLKSALVKTDFQTRGRGTRERSWVMSKGKNLIFSIMIRPHMNFEMARGITMLMAISLVKVLNTFSHGFMIKWPNDIVYNGKKLAGILTEMGLKTDEIQYIVVGVGLNCNEEHFSKDLEKKAISLKNILGEDVDISGLLNLILEEFIENYENYSIEGLSLIIDDLRKYSAVIGKTAEITKGQLKKSCTIIGISDKAELIVKYSNGFVDKVISSQIVVDGFYGV